MNEEFTLLLDEEQELLLDIDGVSQELTLVGEAPVMTDYNRLGNKPRINNVELVGNKTSEELGIEETDPLTNMEIEDLFNIIF